MSSLSHLAAEEVIPELVNTDLERYRGFVMAVISLHLPPKVFSWDGVKSMVNEDPTLPITSSSFDTANVIASRTRLFRFAHTHDNTSTTSLDAYHRTHGERKSAHSVCMHRDDAGTVSYSRITVNANKIVFSYQDGAPCEDQPVSSIEITTPVPRSSNTGHARINPQTLSPPD